MLIATFRTDPGAVALAETLETVPSVEIEADRVAAHGTTWTMPDLWVSAADFDLVDDALAADPSITAIVHSEAFVDEKFYQINWSDTVEDRIDSYVDHEGTILNARATTDGWRLRFRFVSRDQFDDFRAELHDRDRSFELVALNRPDDPRRSVGELTPAQREALCTAKERGYYAVPREITASELATELDMSHQNLSELLRRATETLIDETLDTSADRNRR